MGVDRTPSRIRPGRAERHRRDGALRRISSLTSTVAIGVVALVGGLTVYVSRALPGHQTGAQAPGTGTSTIPATSPPEAAAPTTVPPGAGVSPTDPPAAASAPSSATTSSGAADATTPAAATPSSSPAVNVAPPTTLPVWTQAPPPVITRSS